ncbi:MAG: hypothetical protein U0325_18570 [Polyangiales bacterium]
MKSPKIHPEWPASAPPASRMKTARRWMKRDKALTDATTVSLDQWRAARAAAANKVVLDDDEDPARWRDAGRDDLAARPYVRRQRGRSLLVPYENGDCPHLQATRGIYLLRPDNLPRVPSRGASRALSARLEDGVDVARGQGAALTWNSTRRLRARPSAVLFDPDRAVGADAHGREPRLGDAVPHEVGADHLRPPP